MKTRQKNDKEGPYFVARVGSVKVPVYRRDTPTGPSHAVTWYESGVRKRKFLASASEAEALARQIAKDLAAIGTDRFSLSPEDKVAFVRATDVLRSHGITIDTAAKEWAEAHAILGGRSIVECAREFARLRPMSSERKEVSKLVDEFIAAKEAAGRSNRHTRDLSSRLGSFSKTFACAISDVRLPEIEAWLSRVSTNPRTRRNYLGAVSNLLTFATRRGYIARGSIDLAAIERGQTHTEVHIYTPEQLGKLLQHARPGIGPLIALGAFAGLRTAEILRLEWSEVGPELINVKAAKAKTRQRRLVPILPPLAKWLESNRKPEGNVCEYRNPSLSIAKTVEASGVQWLPNALRHSFGTYRLALVKSESQVALEMGNTPAMVFRHYRAIVAEQAAREWFNVY